MRARPGRGQVVFVPLALLLAGCTEGFPGSTRLLGEWEHEGLEPGGNVTAMFDVQSADYLFVGHRFGPQDRVELSLTAPNGTRFTAQAGEPAQPCSVRSPAAGKWTLIVEADPWDGRAGPGKVTVRAGRGEPPELASCADDVYPGAMRPVTLVIWSGNISDEVRVPFEQPYALRSMSVLARNATENLTLTLRAPDGSETNVTIDAPARGAWQLRATPTNGTTLANTTIAVRGFGAK